MELPSANNLLQPFRQLFPQQYHDLIFLVGGTVRDFLLQQPAHDFDLIAILPAETLQLLGFRLVIGKTTRPIWFRSDDQLGKVELVRLDELCQLDTDLQQRDFSINAIALALTGRLYDPLNGRHDLQQRLLRVCLDQSFVCDPLRIIRGFRFVADGWQMGPEAVQLIKQQDWSDQLGIMPVERFSREMVKALAGVDPGRFFLMLIQFKIGKHWLPELFRLSEIPAGPLQHHPEGDLLTHCLQVLQRAVEVSDDPLTRFCAFFHDIGKLSSNPTFYPKHHGHDESGYRPAIELCKRLCLPAEWGRALAWTSRLHTNLNRWTELRDATKLRIADQAYRAGISKILPVVSKADRPGNSTPDQWFRALTAVSMNSAQLGIDTDQLVAMKEKHRPDFILQHRVEWLRSDGNI